MFFKAANQSLESRTQSQKGQSLVEYLIIVALVAVGGIGVMKVVGQSVNVAFARVAKSLGATTSAKLEFPEIRESAVAKKTFHNFMVGTDGDKDGKADQNQ